MPNRRRLLSSVAIIAIAILTSGLAAPGLASAEVSRKVIGTFKGQLVITKDELPSGKNDNDTIQKIKAQRLSEISGQTNDEDVTSWTFNYTAFLSKAGSTTLKMEFYRDGKQYAADKRLDGVDPKSQVLSGDIQITEDEGLARGKTYVIKLTNAKDEVVAQTKLLMK
jgi:hypothetical protein